jgi:hypothetical protein
MGLFDIFTGKSADNLRQAGQTAQRQLYGAGQNAQTAFNTAGSNAQRDFTALGSNAGAGYGNTATQAGQTLDQGQAGAMPYYGQAKSEYDGLAFSPDLYGGTMRSGYESLADASGANGGKDLTAPAHCSPRRRATSRASTLRSIRRTASAMRAASRSATRSATPPSSPPPTPIRTTAISSTGFRLSPMRRASSSRGTRRRRASA